VDPAPCRLSACEVVIKKALAIIANATGKTMNLGFIIILYRVQVYVVGKIG
jgi:hypothetical protein